MRVPPRALHGLTLTLLWAAFIAGSLTWFSIGPYADMEGHGGILDEQWDKTPSSAQETLRGYGPEGRETYRSFLVADLWFPVAMAVTFGLTALRLARTVPWARHLVWGFGTAMVLDWLENAAFLAWLAAYPGDGMAPLAIAVSLAKLLVVTATSAAFVLALGTVMVRAMSNPMNRRR